MGSWEGFILRRVALARSRTGLTSTPDFSGSSMMSLKMREMRVMMFRTVAPSSPAARFSSMNAFRRSAVISGGFKGPSVSSTWQR